MKKIYKQEVICSITLLLYWTIPVIFRGKQEKLVMQYSNVEWSKVKLLAGLKQKKIDRIQRANAQRHTSGPPTNTGDQKFKKQGHIYQKSTKSMPCIYLMTILVILPNTMKQKGCFIDTSAVLVLHRMARSALIVPVIAKNL